MNTTQGSLTDVGNWGPATDRTDVGYLFTLFCKQIHSIELKHDATREIHLSCPFSDVTEFEQILLTILPANGSEATEDSKMLFMLCRHILSEIDLEHNPHVPCGVPETINNYEVRGIVARCAVELKDALINPEW